MSHVDALGDSIFNYQDYTVWRFIHYYQQIQHVLKLKPKSILEIGPGDHSLTDFLRRKGIIVKTFDNDLKLKPDYSGDIRGKVEINETFDLVLASEILEHMNMKWLDKVLQNISQYLSSNGYLVVSVPYSTIRFFPDRPDYGKVISCEGRLFTYLPEYVLNFVRPRIYLRGIYRMIFKRNSFKEAFRFFVVKEFADDRFDMHHWDLGWHPKNKKFLREAFSKYFSLVEEKTYINTNCVFFILKKKS